MGGAIRIRVLSVPKSGNSADENEDQWTPPRDVKGGGNLAQVSLCDGATEAAFSKEWACSLAVSGWSRLLQCNWLPGRHSPREQVEAAWIVGARQAFEFAIKDRSNSWYTTAKMAREGSFSTFLGLQLTQGRGRRNWAAVACGDTCVFWMRSGRVVSSFPLDCEQQFSNRPPLVPSKEDFGPPPLEYSLRQPWDRGDVFVLATDAVAAWLLANDCDERLSRLVACDQDESFELLIIKERGTGTMKNDDSTIVIVQT